MLNCLKLLILLGLAQSLLGQFLPAFPPNEESSEENAGQSPGSRGTSCRCGWTNKKGRIIGGKQALPNEFPLIVAIEKRWYGHICGGSIITQWHVLTAAHCTVDNKGDIRVMVGTNNVVFSKRAKSTQVLLVDHSVEHEQYNSRTYKNDIAIIVLKTAIQFNELVGPACLPTERSDLLDKFIKVIGWGFTNAKIKRTSDELMKVNLKVVEMNECKWFEDFLDLHVNKDNQICTYRQAKDSCSGDSGGPLVWLDPETNMLTQVALVSYGHPDCGKTKAAVNTNVFDYLPWIKTTIAATKPEANICQKV